jgi:hypothetical protein
MSVADIQESVSRLTDRERAHLAAWLLDSLPPASQDDAIADSLQEAERRRAEIDSGEVQPIGEKDFWSAIERERQGWK